VGCTVTSFLILLAIFYIVIGVALGIFTGILTFIALGKDPILLAALAAGIVFWVVVVWWGPIGVVWIWLK